MKYTLTPELDTIFLAAERKTASKSVNSYSIHLVHLAYTVKVSLAPLCDERSREHTLHKFVLA